eukprot:COSAG02_NODE_29851_length_561_cov_2.419913_1_plen_65_part_10
MRAARVVAETRGRPRARARRRTERSIAGGGGGGAEETWSLFTPQPPSFRWPPGPGFQNGARAPQH